MRKTRKIIISLLITSCLFLIIFPVFKTEGISAIREGLRNVAEGAGIIAPGAQEVDVYTIIAGLVRAFLSLLGVIAVILILYGGFTWLTAGGSEEKIKKAKAILTNAIIGLAIILSAYIIADFVMERLISAVRPGDDAGEMLPEKPKPKEPKRIQI